MNVYILIFEDGSISKVFDEISEDDKQSADDGYLDILRIDFDDNTVTRWNGAGWVEIEEQDA